MSPGRFAHHRVGTSGNCNDGHENVLAVGNCCYVAVCLAAEGASAPTGEERGVGISWRPPTYSLLWSVYRPFTCYIRAWSQVMHIVALCYSYSSAKIKIIWHY